MKKSSLWNELDPSLNPTDAAVSSLIPDANLLVLISKMLTTVVVEGLKMLDVLLM